MQGVSMPFGGLVARMWGFRIVVAVSCLLDSISIFLTYVTVQRSFPGVIITYSVLQGLGLGFGYSVVLSVAATWFPKRRGLVVDVIVGGFGLGALVFTPIETALINPSNIPVDPKTRHFTHPDILDRVPVAFLILGGILLALQVIGFILLRPKPLESTQDRDTELVVRNRINSDPNPVIGRLRSTQTIVSLYRLLSFMYIDDDQFLSIVATFSSLFNAGGRVIWGAIVDRLSFKIPMMIMLVIWAIVLLSFPHIGSLSIVGLKVMYAIWVFILFFSLSGVFVIQPAATGILFGPLNMAVNYGIIFTGFTVGSILCAIITYFINTPNAYLELCEQPSQGSRLPVCGICNASLNITDVDGIERHSFFHSWVNQLKAIGKHILEINDWPVCLSDPVSCNLIPELPTKFECGWEYCDFKTNDVCVFITHVSRHPEVLFSWKRVCSLPEKAVTDGIRPMDVEYLA
ncbi:unnamed protein product [Schistosoma mattheei]|uniref:Uncharacterized protein n=2 Tax=Schistosoma mattheei TaxID=31246 RepID=A0A183PQH9_9TREM|nr:unnamed protein product [Schistosoma mattheei]